MINLTEYHENLPILVEGGAYFSRVGFVGEQDPKKIYHTTIQDEKSNYFDIFQNKLNVDPSNQYIVVIKNTGTTHAQLKQEAHLLFNEFKVKACAFLNAQTGIIFAWAHGYNGLIFDIGYKNSIAVPIISGKPIYNLAGYSNFAGSSIEDYIIHDLIESGLEKEVIERNKFLIIEQLMKEHYYFECQKDDFEFDLLQKRLKNNMESLEINDKIEGKVKYNLPNPILPKELILNNLNSSESSLVNWFIETTKECLSKITAKVLERIIISGGGGQVLGLRSLLMNKLYESTKIQESIDNYEIGIRNVPADSYVISSWLGGSIIFSLKDAYKLMTTKEEFMKGAIIDFCDEGLSTGIKEHKF